jgi:hypothetical protein
VAGGALLLAGNALDVAWMVLPSVEPSNPHALWLLPLLFAGMAGLLFGPWALRTEAGHVAA